MITENLHLSSATKETIAAALYRRHGIRAEIGAIVSAIARLDSRRQRAIVGHMQGQSTRTIGAELGISGGGAHKLITRALGELARDLIRRSEARRKPGPKPRR